MTREGGGGGRCSSPGTGAPDAHCVPCRMAWCRRAAPLRAALGRRIPSLFFFYACLLWACFLRLFIAFSLCICFFFLSQLCYVLVCVYMFASLLLHLCLPMHITWLPVWWTPGRQTLVSGRGNCGGKRARGHARRVGVCSQASGWGGHTQPCERYSDSYRRRSLHISVYLK